jgi:AcrR family transcriptional regulator
VATQEERSAATTAAIRTAARRLFADRGFAGTSMDDIATAAGVTKGGVYHHFDTKDKLFEDVFRAVEADVYDTIITSLPESGSGVDLLVAGTRTFMDCCLAPDVHRIVLVDGPTVLGWKRWREIDADHFLPVVVASLASEAPPGTDVTPIAHLVLGAVDEAVMLLAAEPDPASIVGPITDGIELMIRAVAGAVADGGERQNDD